MDAPILLFNPHVNDFAGRSFPTENSRTITFEEASTEPYFRKLALAFYRNPSRVFPPLEFTQYVLRNSAVNERGCHHFEEKLQPDVRKCLIGLIERQNTDIDVRQIHSSSKDPSNGFRGIFVKYFFKKVVYNLRNEVGRYEYGENFATVFPFQVLKEVPVRYDMEVTNLFNNDFYDQIQTFLNDHFEDVDAREVTYLFLDNVNHFKATRLPEEALSRVFQNQCLNEANEDDYLNSFPRLNHDGVDWFKDLYRHYKNVCKVFNNVDVFLDKYDDSYFQNLPEANFADLYELLNSLLYTSRRKQYIERFEKYLFFFVHALQENMNPIFFIDDVLFECLKSLHRFKMSREDVMLESEIAMLSLVHLRTKKQKKPMTGKNIYRIDPEILRGIKTYIEKIPNIHNAQVDVEYKTDYLHGWMLLRSHDTCYEVCYSWIERKQVNNFIDRILCSVLVSDDEPIQYVVFYNAFRGQESRLKMPQDIETIRNFVRLSNTYDFVNDTKAESIDEFLTRDLEVYFAHLTVAEE